MLGMICCCEHSRNAMPLGDGLYCYSSMKLVIPTSLSSMSPGQIVVSVANSLRDGEDVGSCFRVYAFERLPAGPPVYTHYMGSTAPAIEHIQFWYFQRRVLCIGDECTSAYMTKEHDC